MLFLILGLMVSHSYQQESTSNRCDELRTIQYTTPCTSCAAASTVTCARSFRRITGDTGIANCSYTVSIGQREFDLPGCTHTCEKVVKERRCCPNFWGPLCLACPRFSGRSCNWHGTCLDGTAGNGTCVCKEGFAGLACEECTNKKAYGEHCTSECNCVNGKCNSGPDGDGECYCQPPYSGPKCDQVSQTCSKCPAYSYCKGLGGSAVCECQPGFKKIGRICTGICSPTTCDVNAECSYKDGQFHCKCKVGYEGNGKVCVTVDPCAKDNGGCPINSTVCEYGGPGKVKCVCLSGMESSDVSAGCTLKSACTPSTCHSSARCETGLDGIPRCLCGPQEVSNGHRCYGPIMERILELDQSGNLKGRLTGAISLFESGCELSLSQHGPYTALVPLLQTPLPGVTESLCKHHLIHGQHLYKDLEGNDIWTSSGETIRFKKNKHFIFMKDPDTSFNITQSDIAASNGIIHIIDKPITNLPSDAAVDTQYSSQTIGDILSKDARFNRFLSLVDNCGAPMPLRGAGPLTVFVPTNKAVDRFRDGSVLYMLTDARHKLQELLKHHMFSEAMLTVDQIASMSEITTMAKQVIRINITSDGRIFLGEQGAPLEVKDIIASNGIIHLIDGILIPPSIVPILPHRCDLHESTIIQSPCVRCSYLHTARCPPDSTELSTHLRGCETAVIPPFLLKVMGCAKNCNATKARAECCKGFYGPDCKPCLGGFKHPCYDKGTCVDGIQGNGTCQCSHGFEGIACHICSDPKKHGDNCDEECRCVHGVCDNRPGSMGVCRRGSCLKGYTGDLCDKMATPCNSDGVFEHCHINAYCSYSGTNTICVCKPGYEGDGHSCTPINLCLKPSRGGCDSNAHCVSAGPGTVSCVCNEGWTGDGMACIEMNNCLLESRGGCHTNAECLSIGPGQIECICKKGFMGDGKVCDLVNPCLTNNGGCHDLATCRRTANGSRECICPEDFTGNGFICYSDILRELDGNSDFYSFYRLIQKASLLNLEGNFTALVPSRSAFKNLSYDEETFWYDYYRLPHLVKAHFLAGVFTYEDLQQQVNNQIQTLQYQTKWEIKNITGDLMIDNATILVPNIQAVNGYIHVISTVLRPSPSSLPPVPPNIMTFLNMTPEFSLFRDAALRFNLTDHLPTKVHTILVPFNSAIEEYLKKANSTELDEDTFKYHVIPNEQIFPNDLSDGMLKSTLLGTSYHIMFHMNSDHQMLANEVLIDGKFNETRRGVVMGIPQVLEIHKNRCSQDIILKVTGRCGACDSPPKCVFNSKPLSPSFPPNKRSNCKYRKKVGNKRKTVNGCVMDCLKITSDHSCCPGYYGHECFKCPGKTDNWCSNNGKCQDGVLGNGECLCNEGFHGTACETCQPGRYGRDCKSECHCVQGNGRCLDGIDGNGKCICYKGWKGVNCSAEIVADKCGGVCDENANCVEEAGGTSVCSCVAGYRGNGTYCKEINLCENNNGGCSINAKCTKISPGERTCTCHQGYAGDGVYCLEIDPCVNNNGGCDRNALCIKTGPNTASCICKDGYRGDGHVCNSVNPCFVSNGGCSIHAMCKYISPGERNCTCFFSYRGDGFNCAGSVSRELLRSPNAKWFRTMMHEAKLRDLYARGTVTLFVPHSDYVNNNTIEPWKNTSHITHLLRYHIVGCEELLLSDLKSIDRVVATSGHVLKFSVKEGVLYINDDAKIVASDQLAANGVIHYIDKILIPYDMKKKTSVPQSLNATAAANAYGYTKFSQLLQDTNLMTLVENSLFQPFTMFWPTDAAFNQLPEERKTWLYSPDHQDKLQAYLKAHMIRDFSVVAVNLPSSLFLRTMYGTSLSFNCDKNEIGGILIDNNNAKIIERHLRFDVGIAYGIDQFLEPPNLGARCDGFQQRTISGRCGSCLRPPDCPLSTVDLGTTSECFMSPYILRYSPYSNYHNPFRSLSVYNRLKMGCSRQCNKTEWTFQCCKNHYGGSCQVCHGGLEAPCGLHGDCDDGTAGTGLCRCHNGFKGSACELCMRNHYGANCTACNCTVNGQCDDGIDGSGSCFCSEGWTGGLCETKLGSKPVCFPVCHSNAVCLPDNQCECQPPYVGEGVNCTAPDFCSESNGGCHQHADCTQAGINVTCTCQQGHSGDGTDCSPIDRCMMEQNGGCSDFASCIFKGPNERDCQCLPEYVGDGIQCLQKVVPPVDRCLDNNGGCDAQATCKDLHFHTNTAGVFHLRPPAGRYKMNFTTAEAACQAEGATLATFSQMSDAQQLGMHLCVAGWMDEKKVGYPIRFPSVKCGDNRVGIILYKEPVDLSTTYDAYCYRMRDVECVCQPMYVGNGDFCNGNLASVLATNAKLSKFYKALLDYSNTAVEGANLLNFMSTSSSFATLFVPHNDGFLSNETLSWRDMEYHISTNNSVHFFENMTHNFIIQSRLGYNLTILTSKPHKLINKRKILDWNIPATNGILHIIEGPLKAPPQIVKPPEHVRHRSSTSTIASSLLVLGFIILLGGGIAYYLFKHKNDAFRFQYFKNDDEDNNPNKEGTSPALVSIPNPLYTGFRAFAEPFGDTPVTETEAQPNLID
ncbi:stabilin-1 isoform X2 [Denticeps clupeoides]|uniref:stabilin-1 isoform X2 n=1 Tax=Denticeps clupeoides TaxID=299321 RepID=UPI0010A3E2CE|nr:stabilin-1 isoform X2 [Denticeps clupeoides]